MFDATKIREHMEVVGSDGGHVGTVDHMDGERIKLTKNDPSAAGEHHFVSPDHVASVDDKVRLSKSAAEARSAIGL